MSKTKRGMFDPLAAVGGDTPLAVPKPPAKVRKKKYKSQLETAIVTARVPKEHAAQLRAIAEARDQSLNRLLCEIFEGFLEQNEDG